MSLATDPIGFEIQSLQGFSPINVITKRLVSPFCSSLLFLGVHLDILDEVESVRDSSILHHANVLRAHIYADAGASTDRSFQLLGYLLVVVSDTDIDLYVLHRVYSIQSNMSNKTRFVKFVKIRRPKTRAADRSSPAPQRIDYLLRTVTSFHAFHPAPAEGLTKVCGLHAAGQRRAREYEQHIYDSHVNLPLQVVFSIHRCSRFAAHPVF